MALSPFDEVIQRLFQDPGLPRIKKLLVFTCNQIWESDPHRLSQYNMQDLLASLLAIAPTRAQLTLQLSATVSRINKPAEYAHVAQAVIEHLEPLYAVPPVAAVEFDPMQMAAIAQQLESTNDPLRIRKLLYAVCHHLWENDPTVLTQPRLETLVQAAYQLHPTLSKLQEALYSIVKTLNRQTEYSRIAQTILQIVEPLYCSEHEPQTQIVITAPLAPPHDDTQLVFPIAEPPRPAIARPAQQDNRSIPQPAAAPEPDRPVQPAPYSLDNLFDLRLDLIKFTNPLRLKALIFSVVHAPLTDDQAIAALLKGQELDELLRHLFYNYPRFDQLEAELKRVVQRLPETGQYAQVSAALLRVIKPVYEAGTEGLRLTGEAPLESSRRFLQSADGHNQDETCQFSAVQLAALARPDLDLSDDPHTVPLGTRID